ncbi:hypothetical protein D3C71_1468320 [compost metagenome]
MREQVGRAPQQLHAGCILARLGQAHHVLQVLFVLPDILGVRRQVDIVETPVRHAQLGEELECRVHLRLGGRHRRAGLPGEMTGTRTERIVPGIAEGVPVTDCKAQMFLHGPAADDLVRVVDLERERVVRAPAFEGNAADAGEVFLGADERLRAHGASSCRCARCRGKEISRGTAA